MISIDDEQDFCVGNPCARGFCFSGYTGFTCDCQDGFIGSTCNTPDPCQSFVCKNGGTCLLDNQMNPFCFCPKSYNGIKCQCKLIIIRIYEYYNWISI